MFARLNKVAGSLFAGVLYPIKSLLFSAILIGVSALIFALAILAITPIAIIMVYAKSKRIDHTVGAGLFALLMATIVFPSIFSISLSVQFFKSIVDVFNSIRLGVINGYKYGLFSNAMKEELTSWGEAGERIQTFFTLVAMGLRPETALQLQLQRLLQRQRQRQRQRQPQPQRQNTQLIYAQILRIISESRRLNAQQAPNGNEFNNEQDFFHLPDVPLPDNAFPDLVDLDEVRREFIPLTVEELANANEVNALKGVCENYINLYNRLVNLDNALKEQPTDGPLSDILVLDELFGTGMEVTTPYLLVKQFEEQPGLWKAVPTATHIIDKEHFENWMKRSYRHPLTNDPIDKPLPHLGKNTRYKWYPYESMQTAQLLFEQAETIRRGLSQPLSPGVLTQNIDRTLFGATTDNASPSVDGSAKAPALKGCVG
jgi:hypothetical protein